MLLGDLRKSGHHTQPATGPRSHSGSLAAVLSIIISKSVLSVHNISEDKSENTNTAVNIVLVLFQSWGLFNEIVQTQQNFCCRCSVWKSSLMLGCVHMVEQCSLDKHCYHITR